MKEIFEFVFEAICWIIGGYLVYKVGGWYLFGAMWLLLTANNILMFRRYREYTCKQNTDE